MAYKPADFFISVIDVFGVILPGALFTAVYAGDLTGSLAGVVDPAFFTGTAGVTTFLVVSYLFGHILFLIGSLFDVFYNAAVKRMVTEEANRGFKAADELRRTLLGGVAPAFNTYQWCITYLRVRKPEHLAPIERLEADSKFFRTLVPVFLAALPPLATKGSAGLVLFVAVLALLALWRYVERRWKSNQLAFWLVIEEARERGVTWS